MKKLMTVLGLVIVLSMLLSACAQATATQAPAQPPAETSAPVATEAPTAVPPTTRTGAWVDEVDFSAIAPRLLHRFLRVLLICTQ
jgi:PBP1b-binding outer membrane lipoprotein LpoB